MPGMAFHITARIVRKEPLFQSVEAAAERIIVDGIASSDAFLLAHVVMPNHFHMIIRQGQHPLGAIMQPIMRRLALLIQHSRQIQGHIFERRFRSNAFEDAIYLRRSIVYSDMNPLRAGLCTHPADYPWCSHSRIVARSSPPEEQHNLITVLQLFAQHASDDFEYLRAAYLNYVKWRMAKDAHDRAGKIYRKPEPSTDFGDQHFATTFRLIPRAPESRRPDLRDRAMFVLEDIDRECRIEQLRRRTLSRRLSPIRDELIAALLQGGYRNYRIADFFGVSPSKVSRIAIAMRYGRPA